ncbi:GTPase ObgE [Candidatus Wolfebacteria bacterium CG03_land_8_20_14_0_80_36_15]|uniref:GTPase Obg n=1 Tax=Candidatus Wolfebacteria bacterium CG03_land_8_20_14_0_80_36_15 TaxID=1975067 RepID=A0A2M7B851_9BACT|nr:MAG: GTPase ObgE [Candidatus Wolfebacteria bacterium CG03_land_8_20_14_0_80_36_15]
MLVDDITIKVSAGNGGKGAVAFNTNLKSLGPVGGSGGHGGSVYAEGSSNLNALGQFRFKKVLKAENGMDGRGQFRDGHDGKDLILKVPVGTIIHNLDLKNEVEIIKIGERILLAKGGRGGKGNFHFRSSKNTSPKQFQSGLPGENFDLHLELKFIADVGFIGLPNVGKSSLLNELTNSKSKVANYQFTTLEPNLGIYYELILADIPGLIENSSQGKGLGIKFLRHIERTRILFHFISAESLDPEKDYEIIRKELGAYNKSLLQKPEYLFLTKNDLITNKIIEEKVKIIKKINPNAIAISILDPDSLKSIKDILNKIELKKSK